MVFGAPRRPRPHERHVRRSPLARRRGTEVGGEVVTKSCLEHCRRRRRYWVHRRRSGTRKGSPAPPRLRPRGIFCSRPRFRCFLRATFFVDGFNLYHSLRKAESEVGKPGFKWLDVAALCRSMLSAVGGGARFEKAFYFSAPPEHMEVRSPGALNRHHAYVSALRASGVHVELGRFKARPRGCYHCGQRLEWFEEKESDVALAVALLREVWTSACEVAVLVTADSDLAPAIRELKRSSPQTRIAVAFPWGRGSHELRSLCHVSMRIRAGRYRECQLPSEVMLPGGGAARRPPAW